ncbi:hypothetical protein BSKO_05429 [Bryopsis sp. KO-2023]|nr:hypothetical protein BSKO_05429 [Bryopsis sp. KO-2023]
MAPVEGFSHACSPCRSIQSSPGEGGVTSRESTVCSATEETVVVASNVNRLELEKRPLCSRVIQTCGMVNRPMNKRRGPSGWGRSTKRTKGGRAGVGAVACSPEGWKSSVETDASALIGAVVRVPATEFSSQLRGLYYRGKVVEQHPESPDRLIVNLLEDEACQCSLPAKSIQEWQETETSSFDSEDTVDMQAAKILLHLKSSNAGTPEHIDLTTTNPPSPPVEPSKPEDEPETISPKPTETEKAVAKPSRPIRKATLAIRGGKDSGGCKERDEVGKSADSNTQPAKCREQRPFTMGTVTQTTRPKRSTSAMAQKTSVGESMGVKPRELIKEGRPTRVLNSGHRKPLRPMPPPMVETQRIAKPRHMHGSVVIHPGVRRMVPYSQHQITHPLPRSRLANQSTAPSMAFVPAAVPSPRPGFGHFLSPNAISSVGSMSHEFVGQPILHPIATQPGIAPGPFIQCFPSHSTGVPMNGARMGGRWWRAADWGVMQGFPPF